MPTWNEQLVANQAEYLDDLITLLRFKSVSADSLYTVDVQNAANWIVQRLQRAGFGNARQFPPETHPIIYAEYQSTKTAATILIYGHYDVQPPDPLNLWTTPPFEPTIRDGRIYARGATDMKANLLLPIHAFEALIDSHSLGEINIKVLFEGQEEIGSPDLQQFVSDNKDLLACDYVISADSGQWSETQPAIWLGVRGMAALQVDITGPSHDLHSGIYGGGLQNPIHAITELLAGLHDQKGRVTVNGFYDDVVELTADESDAIQAVPFVENEFFAETGVKQLYGEEGYSSYERMWVRPTLEINGIWGGYQGEGPKTVIPAEAHAKITCRLVANQQPGVIRSLVRDHLERHAPVGVDVKVTLYNATAKAYSTTASTPGNKAAIDVLTKEYGVAPIHVRSGGSVPIYDMFKTALGAETVMFGFGLEDENLHSPNEFIRLANVERGRRAYCTLLQAISSTK